MKRDYIITFITEFTMLAIGLLLYKLAASMFGQEGFSLYALVRRNLSFLQPLLIMGLGVGIPRYIGYSSLKETTHAEDGYFLGGLFVSIIFTIIFCILAILYAEYSGFWLFGSSYHSIMIIPLCTMLLGSNIQSLCYSYFRGKTMMIQANLLQIVAGGIVPLMSFLLFGSSIYWTLIIMGILWFVISVLFCTYRFISINQCLEINVIIAQTKEVLNYSIRRVPGDFALTTLLALPVTFVAHYSGITDAGFVALGIAVFGMVGSVTSPVGIILLPQASYMIARGNETELKQLTVKILKYSVFIALFLTLIFQLGSKDILNIYLGKGYEAASNYIGLILIGSVPYAVYLGSRSVLDAITIKAVNAKNLIISLSFFILISSLSCLFKLGVNGMLISFVISIYLLGGLTLYQLQRFFKNGSSRHNNRDLVI